MGRIRRGFILPMVLFGLAIMGVLVLAVVSTSADDRHGSRNVLESTRSFYAADAGLNQIVAEFDLNDYRDLVSTPGTTADLGWQNLPGRAGRYRGVIRKLADNLIELTVDGRSGAAGQGLRTVQVLFLGRPMFTSSAFGGANVIIEGGSSTDSFDSDLGGYGASSCTTLGVTCNGDLGSNGNISQLCTVTGCIHGDARVVGTIAGGCPNAAITGVCDDAGFNQPQPPVACPASYTPAASMPPLSSGHNYTYSQATGVFTVSGNNTVDFTVPPTTYNFSRVDISSSNAQVNFHFGSPAQHLDLYVSGDFDVSGGAQINNLSQKPTLLSIIGCGTTGPDSWSLSGSSASYFAVYAPNKSIRVAGSAGLYGSVVGTSVDVAGGAAIHYDASLGRSSSIVFVPGSWTELAR